MPSRVIEGTPIVSAEGHSRSEPNRLALIRMDKQPSHCSASPVNPAKEVSVCSSSDSATIAIFAKLLWWKETRQSLRKQKALRMFHGLKAMNFLQKKHKSSSILQGKGPQLPTIPSNKETQGAHAAPVPVEKGPGEFFSFYMLNVCHPAG